MPKQILPTIDYIYLTVVFRTVMCTKNEPKFLKFSNYDYPVHKHFYLNFPLEVYETQAFKDKSV